MNLLKFFLLPTNFPHLSKIYIYAIHFAERSVHAGIPNQKISPVRRSGEG